LLSALCEELLPVEDAEDDGAEEFEVSPLEEDEGTDEG
jgi:hypothetical protein